MIEASWNIPRDPCKLSAPSLPAPSACCSGLEDGGVVRK